MAALLDQSHEKPLVWGGVFQRKGGCKEGMNLFLLLFYTFYSLFCCARVTYDIQLLFSFPPDFLEMGGYPLVPKIK